MMPEHRRNAMRKLFVSNLMSLDGFFETTDHKLDWCVIDNEFFDYADDMLRSVDLILFGRKTYEHMAAFWPTAPRDRIADQMNGLAKIVFSKTLSHAGWQNSRLVAGNAADEVTRLKQQPGKDIVILGSAMLASSLLVQGLVDEYRVILNPVLLGQGNLLFKDVRQKIALQLSGARSFRSGVSILYYQKHQQSNM
jgi:dihydrofolate reductase